MSDPKTVSCTINGQAITVPEGTRIIEAAEQLGLGIATYCYHPALSAPAMCRMCLVEVEGAPKLQPACVTPVMEGNKIQTESDKAREARQGNLEFYLVNHPLDCPVCDAAGECKLQDFVYAEGRKHGRSIEPKRVLGQDDFGGDILYDGDRCIMCTRCVRFMREIAGNDALCVVQRGNRSIIDTFFDQGVEGDLWAGNIVDICPVGALLSKDFLHKARAWDLDGAPSICPNCSQGCNIRVDTRDNLVMRLKPRLNPDVNSYWMCDHGRYRYEWLNAGDRISAPLVRDSAGKLVATGWSQAITSLVEGARARAGARVIASPFHSVEDAGLAARLAAVMGGGNELRYRSERVADEVVCPGFPKLARRRELAANTHGLEIVGYRRVGDERGQGGLDGGARVLIVLGDQLLDQPESFGRDAELFIYIGHTLTAAARNAHYVLPATTFGEQEGTFVNHEGRVQRFWPALQAPGLARPAWQVLGVLLSGLGDGHAPASAGNAFTRLSELHDEFAGLSYELLGARGALINSRMKLSAGGAEVH